MVETALKPLKVGVVIVSYNSSEDLEKCIDSVGLNSHANLTALPVVVDNNSSDKSVKVAESTGAIVIANEKNLGFAKAVNIGVRYALEQDCDYILLLNPDATLSENALAILIKNFEEHTNVAAVGPKIFDDKQDINDHYYLKAPGVLTVLFFYTFLRSWALQRKFLLKLYTHTELNNEVRGVEQIPGACLLASKEKFLEVGLLDEDFAIWFEDVEWSYRAKKMGYRLLYCPDAHVFHEGGVSFSKWLGVEKTITFLVSMKTFFRKHMRVRMPLVVSILCVNYFLVYLKTRNRAQLRVISRLIFQKKGTLPN